MKKSQNDSPIGFEINMKRLLILSLYSKTGLTHIMVFGLTKTPLFEVKP